MKKINFSAGPCILPESVLQQASKAVLELDNQGLSLIEMSHRSSAFIAIMEEAQNLVKELLGLDDNYSVLFLQGGASLGFYMTALNYLVEGKKAAYINTGVWSKKAIKEAALVGEVDVIASSEKDNFTHIPKQFSTNSSHAYLHYTSNNTIHGTQWKNIPSSDVPLICDMSSDIFSKKLDASKFAMIYAGAQKNLGPAGTTLYIVNNNYLGKVSRKIPSMLDLKTHIDGESMYNTPPVFPIYVSMLTLRWLKALGGLDEMGKINQKKAELLYNEIDANPLFIGTAAKEDRSFMNVTFLLKDESLQDQFNAAWNAAGISGIKGHRSVGGYRASIYNAMPLSGVQVLTEVMKEFALKNA